jgi:hypothetical protein
MSPLLWGLARLLILAHEPQQVKLRLQTHKANVAAVIESYKDVIKHVSLSYQNLSFLACGYCSGGGFLQIVLFCLL